MGGENPIRVGRGITGGSRAAFHRVEGPARDRAEGEVVTLKWRILRRSWDMINSTHSTRNVAVGTTKKSIATAIRSEG